MEIKCKENEVKKLKNQILHKTQKKFIFEEEFELFFKISNFEFIENLPNHNFLLQEEYLRIIIKVYDEKLKKDSIVYFNEEDANKSNQNSEISNNYPLFAIKKDSIFFRNLFLKI